MLVIVSDLHLTDGTSGETIRAGAFRVFAQRLRDLAYDASWRAPDGEGRAQYRPIEEMHVVLLGDILDVIRSTKWLKEDGVPCSVRPWDDPQRPDFIQKVDSITSAILRHNRESLEVIRRLNDGKTMTVPPATPEGTVQTVGWNPDAPGRLPVRVHLHYTVGNHDWMYHLPGKAYNEIRRAIVRALGLDNPPDVPFPYDPAESEPLAKIYREHGVLARHGDIYDRYNFAGDRNRSSVGDAVVVELIDRFAMTVVEEFRDRLPEACLRGLREIDNLRPSFIVPVWLDSLLEQTVGQPELRRAVRSVWDGLVDEFCRLDFVRHYGFRFNPWNPATRARWAFRFTKGLLSRSRSRGLAWASVRWPAFTNRLLGGGGPTWRDAANETAREDGDANFIVYGHTHQNDVVPLNTRRFGNRYIRQIYINSGTWRPYHQLTVLRPTREQFGRYELMTYVAFFRDGERGGRAWEVWTGFLGPRE
jgi:hypothetical protein